MVVVSLLNHTTLQGFVPNGSKFTVEAACCLALQVLDDILNDDQDMQDMYLARRAQQAEAQSRLLSEGATQQLHMRHPPPPALLDIQTCLKSGTIAYHAVPAGLAQLRQRCQANPLHRVNWTASGICSILQPRPFDCVIQDEDFVGMPLTRTW